MTTAATDLPVPRARQQDRARKLHVDDLRPNPDNPRRNLGDLRRLIRSIKAEGVLVPLMVEDRRDGGRYVIIHGHRRWAATKLAGRKMLPAIITDEHEPHDAILAMLAEDEKEPLDDADKRAAILALAREHHVPFEVIADRTGMNINEVMGLAGLAPHIPGASPGGAPRGFHRHHRGAAGASPEPRPGRHRGDTPRWPRFSAASVYELLTRLDDGEVDAVGVVEQLRGQLGDWKPKAASRGGQVGDPRPGAAR